METEAERHRDQEDPAPDEVPPFDLIDPITSLFAPCENIRLPLGGREGGAMVKIRITLCPCVLFCPPNGCACVWDRRASTVAA